MRAQRSQSELLQSAIGEEPYRAQIAVFPLHDAEELRELLDAAGFTDVVVDRHLTTLRLPPPQGFLWQYIHSTPMAEAVAQTGEEARAALEQRMAAGCEPFVDDGALVMEVRMLTGIARRT